MQPEDEVSEKQIGRMVDSCNAAIISVQHSCPHLWWQQQPKGGVSLPDWQQQSW